MSQSPAPLRVLQVLHSHGYGGAESHALLLMKRLREAGHGVAYAGPADGWLAQQCHAEGVAVHDVAMSGLYDLASHWRLRRLVARWQPHIVHGHLIRGSHYAAWSTKAARHLPGPVAVGTVHATTAHKHLGGCRHLIAVCEAVKNNLLAHGHPADRISVVYNGMPPGPPTEDRAALRAELGIAPSDFAVVNVGRFIHDKGQDLLVQALASCPPHTHLHLVGDADTEFGRGVRAQAQGHPRIHFLGYRSDVQRILPAFDAYAVSSRREAFSLSIVEACAAEVPCVATAVGGIPEVIRHEETGVMVPPNQAAALASAITRLAQDPDQRQRWAQAAHTLYEQRFTDQRMVADTLAVYRKALA